MVVSLQFLAIVTLILSFILFFVEHEVQPEVKKELPPEMVTRRKGHDFGFGDYIN